MLIELTMGLPDTHLRPASITDHFDESIMKGTRAIHIDVNDLRAIFDLLACDLDRARIVARHNELFEGGRACDVGAFTDIDESGGRLLINHVSIFLIRLS
jgi:hypothetical protein